MKKSIIFKVVAVGAAVVCACGVGAANKVRKIKERRQVKFGFSSVR